LDHPEYVLDPNVLRYIGFPCIEVAATPHAPKIPSFPRININVNLHTPAPEGSDSLMDSTNSDQQQQQQQAGAGDSALTEDDMFASGLWTVCDCVASQKHPGTLAGRG
jgi:hypothetical protein